jgi:hypothetical protein
MMAGKPRTVQEEINLIKQKYMIQETAVQNIKNKLKSCAENKKTELKSRLMHGQFYREL